MVLRSFRLDDRLAARLAAAAAAQGKSESEFIRGALERAIEADTSRSRTLRDALADVIGAVHGGGIGDSRRVHEAVAEELDRERRGWTRLRDPDRR